MVFILISLIISVNNLNLIHATLTTTPMLKSKILLIEKKRKQSGLQLE